MSMTHALLFYILFFTCNLKIKKNNPYSKCLFTNYVNTPNENCMRIMLSLKHRSIHLYIPLIDTFFLRTQFRFPA